MDLKHLTQVPDPIYTSHLASSHDPLSDTAEPGDADWFANRDFAALVEGQAATLLDVQGPGVITHIWSASPTGVLRVFIDDAEQPAIEAQFDQLLRGNVAPFLSPFAFVAGGGYNMYFPIPFSRSCRITLSGESERLYYGIAYRRYAEHAGVERFGIEALAGAECVRELVADRLSNLRSDSEAVDFGQRHTAELRTEEGSNGAAVVRAAAQGGMLWQLRLSPKNTTKELLRATILAIEFDGMQTVRSPLGDFFAAGPGADEINSVPLGVSPDGDMIARWPMPFSREARIWIESTNAGENEATLEVVSDSWLWDEENLYFHAQWRAPETFPSKPSRDWPLAHIEGTGLYVGNALNIVNRAKGWWGEGDEKIYVDGESFPSHFGTGTEDYYGYAWCSNEVFTTAYLGQPTSTAHQSFGYNGLYRFHVLDPIPFQTSLRFDLEVRHWGDPVDVTYDSLSFWYARAGARAHGISSEAESFRIPALATSTPEGVLEGPYVCGP